MDIRNHLDSLVTQPTRAWWEEYLCEWNRKLTTSRFFENFSLRTLGDLSVGGARGMNLRFFKPSRMVQSELPLSTQGLFGVSDKCKTFWGLTRDSRWVIGKYETSSEGYVTAVEVYYSSIKYILEKVQPFRVWYHLCVDLKFCRCRLLDRLKQVEGLLIDATTVMGVINIREEGYEWDPFSDEL